MKKILPALSVLAMLVSAAEAKVYRHTYNPAVQSGSVTLANPQLTPLMLKPNQNSTSFKLAAKTRVAISVSATCAVATPGVGIIPPTDLKLFLKIQVDGQTLPTSAGHLLCSGDATDELDNFDASSVTIAKTLPAGLHTLQLIPNPHPVVTNGSDYLITGLSVVVTD